MGYFAKEGYPWIFIGVFITVATYINTISPNHPKIIYFLIWTVPMIGVTIFLTFFFRDPNRSVPEGFDEKRTILCPADGHMCAIEEENGNLAFYIEMHLTNAHVCRAHMTGKVKKVHRTGGRHYPIYYLRKENGKTSEAIRKNARVTVEMEDSFGRDFTYQLICGKMARRAKPYVREGQYLKKGERMGIIMFGSLVKVTLPGTDYELNVKIGDKVRAKKMSLCETKKTLQTPCKEIFTESTKSLKKANQQTDKPVGADLTM